jgi:hypothetical protein
MAQLFLPAAHTESDLVLAGQIAECIDSCELYVAWTPRGGRAVPEVMAELRAAAPRWTEAFALVFAAARELWCALVGRDPYGPAARPASGAGGEPAADPAPGEAAA